MKKLCVGWIFFFILLFFHLFLSTAALLAAGTTSQWGYALLTWDYDYSYTRPNGPNDNLHLGLSESYNLDINYIRNNGQLQYVNFLGPDNTPPTVSGNAIYTIDILNLSGIFYQGDEYSGYVKVAELKLGDAATIYDPFFDITSWRSGISSVDSMTITSSTIFFPQYDNVLPWTYQPLTFLMYGSHPEVVPLNIQELDRCLDPSLTCTYVFNTNSTFTDDEGYSKIEKTKLTLKIVAGSQIDLPPVPPKSPIPQTGIMNLLLNGGQSTEIK